MKYKLQDIIDIEHFQNLQDRLNEIYSFPSSIIDNDGNILTATAWQDICTKFHRANKECERECIKSDQYILEHLHEANPAVSYQCPHGLVDNATPIIIDGTHYGNFFTGQFFLEKPDLDFFRAQARKHGFDEEAYIEAVKKVPIWTQEQLNSYLFFIKGLIAVISESGLKTLKEIENRKDIQESEARYRSILKAAMDGYWRTDTSGRLLEVNDAYCRMSGYSENELLAMHIPDLEYLESPEIVAAHMQNVIAGGSDRFETRHRRKDGTAFDVEVSVQYRSEDGGQCICFVRDITEHKQKEQMLQDREEKLRQLTDNIAEVFWIGSADWNEIYYISPAYENIWGSSCDSLYKNPRSWIDAIHEEDRNKVISHVPEEAKLAEEFVFPEYRIVRPDGAIRWIYARAFPVRDDRGEIYRFAGIAEDITERKQSDEALLQSEMQFRHFFDHLTIGVAVYEVLDDGEDFVFVDMNPAGQELSKVSIDDIRGKRLTEVFPGAKDLGLFQALQKVWQTGNSEFVPFSLYKDGRIQQWVENRVFKLPSGKIVAVYDDQTERMRLEEGLRQAQKIESVGRLAGGVAHDFNNMLSVILGRTEMILEDTDPNQRHHADLLEIKEAAQRSADVTRQLLAFARKQTISPEVVDLNGVIENMLKMLRRLIGEDIELLWHPGKHLWPVKMDPSQLDQVLANLGVNARDAITGAGKLTIETGNVYFDKTYCDDHPGFSSGDFVQLAISDNGCGMDEEVMKNVFEPFFTTKGVDKGTGLGLATVYGIVKQNNGFINVYSEPNKGTSFKIYLPRHTVSGEKVQAGENAEAVLHGNEVVLLVEDEVSILRMTEIMLKRLGYTVLTANKPKDALDLARKHNGEIHLLLTDIVMPGMNGQDLLRQLLPIYPGLRSLFMSGYTANVIAHHGVLDEGIHYIQKPFSKQVLSVKLRKVLGNNG